MSQSEDTHFPQNPRPCYDCAVGTPTQTNAGQGAYAVGWSCEPWNPICLNVTTPVNSHTTGAFFAIFGLPLSLALAVQLSFGARRVKKN